ncbi:MAG: glycerol-3-phosphate dehydrogenase/oxidase [Candidatus Binatia bacterium]|nr:MAG: glycerol-3-phosphate dehydrogenase/oxidase [Candidatus Binatia bacterium]
MPVLGEWSARTRTHNLARLEREHFDLLVIGGGITGAGVAREAALRGLRVALVERRDFANGTSSRSSKLIHGGLRYLAQGDVGLVREAATERKVLRRLAPHLARPIQMLVPVYSRAGYLTIRAGLFTYDRLAGVSKEERNRMLDRDEALALEPLLKGEKLYGAGLYYEYLTDDARLVLDTLKAASALGALATNYTPVVRLELEDGALCGAWIADIWSGSEVLVRAHVVVNAAGPWVDEVRAMQDRGLEKRRLHLTKGIHLIVPRERLPIARCVVMPAADKRSVFAIPHNDLVYLGTTDTDYFGRYDDPPITVGDAQYLLAAANRALQVEPLQLADVVGAWAGLRPLLHEEGRKPSEISRKDEIMVGPTGLISVAGGKLTTYRKMARRIVRLVTERLKNRDVPLPPAVAASEEAPLSGGDFEGSLDALAQSLQAKWSGVRLEVLQRLVSLYGSNADWIAGSMVADPALAEEAPGGSGLTRAEVLYNVRHEMALTLQDVLERRTRLFLWDRNNGLRSAPAVAEWMAQWLDWPPERKEQELRDYRAHVADVKTFRPSEPDAAGSAAHA